MPNILILDNDPTVCSVIKASLRKTTHKIFVANDILHAKALARKVDFELALLDVETAHGSEQLPLFITELRKLQAPRPCKIALTSSVGKSLGDQLSEQVNGVAFFGKPFSLIGLRNFVKQTLTEEIPVALWPHDSVY